MSDIEDPISATCEQVKMDADDLENGLPISCYQMKLTDEGFHVKTALYRDRAR